MITSFLVVLTIGYAIGLAFVDRSTSLAPGGIQEQFLGTPEGDAGSEVRYAKSPNEMYVFLHNHLLSLSLVFFAVGGIFSFSSAWSVRFRTIVISEPFAALITTFGGIALVRYVSPVFSWLVLFSGISMTLCYGLMVFLILKELWGTRGRRTAAC